MVLYDQNGYRVVRADTVRCSCYLVTHEKRTVLIDTSMKFERSALLKSIGKAELDHLNAIFLTHSHSDHAANAGYLSDIYHCPVYVSEQGLENVRNGACTMPKGTRLNSKLIYRLERWVPFYDFKKYEPCPNAEPLTADIVKQYLGSHCGLLHTPGHTDDSISILLDERIVLLGDSAVNMFGSQYPPFADDEPLLKKTWAALLATGAEVFCPAHGKPFTRAQFQRAYQMLEEQQNKRMMNGHTGGRHDLQ